MRAERSLARMQHECGYNVSATKKTVSDAKNTAVATTRPHRRPTEGLESPPLSPYATRRERKSENDHTPQTACWYLWYAFRRVCREQKRAHSLTEQLVETALPPSLTSTALSSPPSSSTSPCEAVPLKKGGGSDPDKQREQQRAGMNENEHHKKKNRFGKPAMQS